MKSILKFAVLAALAGSFALVSCGGDGGGSDVAAPKYKKEAAKYVFETPTKYRSIEFTEGGLAIIEAPVELKSGSSDGTYTIKVVKYTVSNGVYNVPGIGTVTVSGSTITIGGTSYAVTVAPKKSGASDGLYRSWSVKRTILSVKGGSFGSTGIGKTFNGFDQNEIVKYIEENNVKITEDLSGYDVQEIAFTEAGTFVIYFKTAEPFVGTWNISGNRFSYDLVVDGNSILNASASGSIDVSKDGSKCTVIIKGTFTSGGDTYSTEVELELTAVA